MKLKLNDKEYAIKEKIDFGYLYMLNARLKRIGSNFMKLSFGIADGDILGYLIEAGVMITGLSLDDFNNELDKMIENEGDLFEFQEKVSEIVNFITSSAQFENFMKAAVKFMEKGAEMVAKEENQE